MTRILRAHSWRGAAALFCILLLVLTDSTASAKGIPKADPLSYSGIIGNSTGGVATGNKKIGVSLWTSQTGGTKACATLAKAITLVSGRFRLTLDTSCLAAISKYPDLWSEVIVDGISTGRRKVGAVPYAMQAKNSQSQNLTNTSCPGGYQRDLSQTGFVLCKKGKDEMVRSGSYWIDRYEASVVDASAYNSGSCDGAGKQYGKGSTNDYPASFPPNGNATTKLFACSRLGHIPSAWATWFQAATACAASGKHLCSNGEWQAAAYGTPDDKSSCNISSKPAQKR